MLQQRRSWGISPRLGSTPNHTSKHPQRTQQFHLTPVSVASHYARAQRHTSLEPWTWLKLQHGVYQHSLFSLYLRFPHLPPQHVAHNMIEDVCENMFVLDNMIPFLQANMYFRFGNSEFNILLNNSEATLSWQQWIFFTAAVSELQQPAQQARLSISTRSQHGSVSQRNWDASTRERDTRVHQWG